jgi:predicted NUDIX family NTP pyrophosphohydrolase
VLYRWREEALEVLLVHPGGPFWAKRDDGAWSIPKGEYDDDEDPLDAAIREFGEELGSPPPSDPPPAPLGEIRQSGGKRVRAWAVEGDLDVEAIESGTFPMEWPPHSGKTQEFPEVDRAGWFDPEEARHRLLRGQAAFVDRLLESLGG